MDIFERIRRVYSTVFGVEDTNSFSPNTLLFAELGMNSIGLLYMAVAIEQEFDISFANEDIQQLRTVRDVMERVQQRLEQK